MSKAIPEGVLEASSKGSVILSKSRRFRYLLTRHIADKGRPVVFVMLNPSTADASIDDATIRRCIGFARRWKASSLVVVNLFGLRATDPRELRAAANPTGKMNKHWVRTTVARKDALVVCAWGAHGDLLDMDEQVKRWMRKLKVKAKCLGTTKDGHPKHPLRLSYDTKLVPFDLRDRWAKMPVPVYSGRGVEWL